LAAQRNPTLAATALDVSIANADVTAARGADDTIWDAAAGYQRSRRVVVPDTPIQLPRTDAFILSTSLTQPLPSGGQVGLRLSTQWARNQYWTDFGGGPDVSTANSIAPSVELFASHPLLRGAGVSVARVQRRRARAAHDLAVLSREIVASALVRDVVTSYWETLFARGDLEIRRALTESARQQLLAVQAGISVEKLPSSAAAEVEVAVAVREDNAIAAEAALRAQSFELARLVGLDLDESTPPIDVSDTPDTSLNLEAFDTTLAAAMDHNLELAAIRSKGHAAAIAVDIAKNDALPTLDLAVQGGTSGDSDATSTALGQLSHARSYDLTFGLVFREPLGRHTAQGALGAAEASSSKLKLNEVDLAAQVRSAVLRQRAILDAARHRIVVLANTVETATLDLEAERARFMVGRANNFDVLRRQDELAEAQSRSLRARVDALRAAAELEALTGDILGHYGVALR